MKKSEQNPFVIADASHSNWVDKFCPFWSKPFLKLSRFDRPIGSWLLLLPCWWGSTLALLPNTTVLSIYDYWILLSCTIGAFLMRGAGCTWNDINDRNFDKLVARTKFRPIPSGQVSLNQALIWMLIQAALAFLILLTFNQFAILVGVISIFPVAIYPFAKRFTWWPQFFLGICFNWGILLGFAAHTGNIQFSTFILYCAGIFWTIFYDTIYAFQDSDDDALIGLKSTALLFGKNAKYWLMFFAFMCFVLIQASINQIENLTFISEIIMRCGGILFYVQLIWQVWQFDAKDKNLCLQLFKSNKGAGLIIVIFAIFAVIQNHL